MCGGMSISLRVGTVPRTALDPPELLVQGPAHDAYLWVSVLMWRVCNAGCLPGWRAREQLYKAWCGVVPGRPRGTVGPGVQKGPGKRSGLHSPAHHWNKRLPLAPWAGLSEEQSGSPCPLRPEKDASTPPFTHPPTTAALRQPGNCTLGWGPAPPRRKQSSCL